MNVIFDDFVDGLFDHIQTVLPSLETVTEKTSERLSAPRPPPSSTDMVYLTDRLVVLSQPASSHVSTYTDIGRDCRETSRQAPNSLHQLLDGDTAVGKNNDNEVTADEKKDDSEERPCHKEQQDDGVPNETPNLRYAGLVDEDDASNDEMDVVRQSLDAALAGAANTKEIKLEEKISSQEKVSKNEFEDLEQQRRDTESNTTQQCRTESENDTTETKPTSLEETTRNERQEIPSSVGEKPSSEKQVNRVMGDPNDETDSGLKQQNNSSLPQHAQRGAKPILNSPGTIVTYLDKRHGTNTYLAFSLMDSPPDDRTLLLFRRQIVQLGWWSPCIERSETPSISKLLKVCYAIHAFLQLDPANVAMVYCSNGKTRTAIAMACYFKFAGMVQHSYQGFLYFLSKRGITKPEATWKELPPSLHLFFRQFDSALEMGGFLNRKPLLLRAIALQGIPVEDMPCLDIWDSSQRHVYSSHPEMWSDKEKSAAKLDKNSQHSSQWGDEEGFYKVNVILEGDFLLLCRFGGDYAHETTIHDPSKILFRYANTTGFLSGGCPYEFPSNRVDLMRQYASHLDDEDFLLTLLFEADWEEVQENEGNAGSGANKSLSRARRERLKRPSRTCSERVWRSYEQKSCEEGWKVIHQCHSARPDASDIKDFQNFYRDQNLEKCSSNLKSLVLQLTNFQYKRARELLFESSSFAWWQQTTLNEFQKDAVVSSKDEQKGQDNKLHFEKREKVFDSDKKYTDEIFDILAHIDVTRNLEPMDVVQVDDIENRQWEQSKSQTQVTPKRAGSYICNSAKNTSDLCLRDYGWMVPTMAFPRPGDIAGSFGQSYEQMQSKIDYSDPTFESKILPRVPFFPRGRPSIIPPSSKRRRTDVLENESIYPVPPHDERQEMAEELYMQICHTGVTLPGLVSLLESSQRWGDVPELEEELNANDVQSGNAKEQPSIKPSASMEATMNRGAKDKKEKEWEEARKAEEAKKKEEREKAEGTKRVQDEAGRSREGEVPLKDDPEYSKYFKMLKMGMQKEQVAHALTRDEKDPSILDLDPDKSLDSQRSKEPKNEDNELPLKNDPAFSKYFKMLKMGMPKEQVAHALTRDDKDPSVLELDPEKSLKSQQPEKGEGDSGPALKDDPEYIKYFKMLSMGLPVDAVKNALLRDGKDPKVMDLDPNKSFKSQLSNEEDKDAGPPLKEDPEYTKYFKMRSMGLPVNAVKNALTRDGKDPTIMDLDPNKSLRSQLGNAEEKDLGTPLKDDPEFTKYFKMLGMGLPKDAVKNALSRDGKDPTIMDLDPNKSVAFQLKKKKGPPTKGTPKKKKKIRRKKIYWNAIKQENLKADSMWHLVRDAVNMKKLNYDEKEFEELFTESADARDKKKPKSEKTAAKKLVQVIDAKRSMNGAIILTRLKLDYDVIAKTVTKMEYNKFDATQLTALKEYLANPDERRGLIGYMKKGDSSPEMEAQLYADLSETEKYMYTMMEVPEPHAKFDAMLFRTVFKNRFEDVNAGIQTLNSACDELRSSEKFRKLMAVILTVVNQINTGGEGSMAIGFTLDALLKLNEAKAFDKKTSVLHYVVKLVKKNDESLLTFSYDISHVIPAESVLLDSLSSEVKSLSEDLKKVHVTVQAEAERLEQAGELKPMTLADLREQRTSVRHSGVIPQFNQMDHHTGRTSMERFTVNAHFSCESVSKAIEDVREKYVALLNYLGEDEQMATGDFFGILRSFMREFKKAVDQVEAIEKKAAKEKRRASARAAKREGKTIKRGSRKTLIKKGQEAAKNKSERVPQDEGKVTDQAVSGIAAMAAAAAARKSPEKDSRDPGKAIGSIAAMAAAAAARKSSEKDSRDPGKATDQTIGSIAAMAAAVASRKSPEKDSRDPGKATDQAVGSVTARADDAATASDQIVGSTKPMDVASETQTSPAKDFHDKDKVSDQSFGIFASSVSDQLTERVNQETHKPEGSDTVDAAKITEKDITSPQAPVSARLPFLIGEGDSDNLLNITAEDSELQKASVQQTNQKICEDSATKPAGEISSQVNDVFDDNSKPASDSGTPTKHEDKSDITIDNKKAIGLKVITLDSEVTSSVEGVANTPLSSSNRSEAKPEGKSAFAAKAAAYRNRKKRGDREERPKSPRPTPPSSPTRFDGKEDDAKEEGLPKSASPPRKDRSKSPTTPSRPSKFLLSAAEYRRKKSSRDLKVEDSEDSNQAEVTKEFAATKDQGLQILHETDLTSKAEPETEQAKPAALQEKKSVPMAEVTESTDESRMPPLVNNFLSPMQRQRLSMQTRISLDGSTAHNTPAEPQLRDSGVSIGPRLGAFLDAQRDTRKEEGTLLSDFLDDSRSEMLRQNFDDSSVAHIAEKLHKQNINPRVSETWSEGDNITNWMNWADQAVNACDSESVVGFETSRDLNDGDDFDDDSTIASFTSYASNYDDYSLATPVNTRPKLSVDNLGGSGTAPHLSFDPYFPNEEKVIDTTLGSNTPTGITPAKVAASILFEDSPVKSVEFAADEPGDDQDNFDPGLALPTYTGKDAGLDSGLTFGADVGFDDGLGGFGDASYNYGDYDDGVYDDGLSGSGMPNTEAPSEERNKPESRKSWFSWGNN